jgi:hypothetical protein
MLNLQDHILHFKNVYFSGLAPLNKKKHRKKSNLSIYQLIEISMGIMNREKMKTSMN